MRLAPARPDPHRRRPQHRARAAPQHPHAVADGADPIVAVEDPGRDRNRPAVLPGSLLRGDPAGQRRGAHCAAGALARGRTCSTQPILRPGSWIGGDRDGNPNVTADVVRLATGSAAFTALAHYFVELTALEEELSMSARLVRVSDDLQALADTCAEPARADEPYRRALRVIHGRLTATAAEILDRQPEHLLDLGMRALRDARRAARRPRRHRRVAARQRQRGAGRRPAGPAAGSGARLRFSPVRSGPAAELRRARGGDRRAAGLGGRAPRLRVAVRGRAGRRCWPPNWPPADRWSAPAPSCPSWPARNSDIVGGGGPRGAGVRARRRCRTTSSRCASRCRTCWRRRSCSRRPGCSTRRATSRTPRSASCRCSRPSTTCSAARRSSKRSLDIPLYRALVARARRAAGGHARLLRLQQGRRLPGGQLGAVPGRTGPGRDRPARPESGCGSSTVAAAPSAAAAARATTPSWRSRPAR